MKMPTIKLLKFSLFSLLLMPYMAFANDVPPTTPDLCIIKEVSPDGIVWFDANTEAEAVTINELSMYRITTTNCGTEKLANVVIEDTLLGINTTIAYFYPGQISVIEASAAGICDGSSSVMNTANASGTGYFSNTMVQDSDVAWVKCADEPELQGCTPGYWKQSDHFDSWPVPYLPTTKFSAVFGSVITVRLSDTTTVTDPSLLNALRARGGNINAAARHVVAALLNGASGDVEYNLSAAEVISLWKSTYPGDVEEMKDRLAMYNEQGCPLN
jgi:hypothetical protein